MKIKIPGLTFSWKRAIGLTQLKQKIARQTGIPMSQQGIERKIGSTMYIVAGLLAVGACQPKPAHNMDSGINADSALQEQILLEDNLRGTAFEDMNIDNKRLLIRYNQPVEGYTVTGVCFPLAGYDRDREHEFVGKAILHFENEDNHFDIYNAYFSDSTLYYVNEQSFVDGQVLHLDYLPKKVFLFPRRGL